VSPIRVSDPKHFDEAPNFLVAKGVKVPRPWFIIQPKIYVAGNEMLLKLMVMKSTVQG
jgi:hypothetical protein